MSDGDVTKIEQADGSFGFQFVPAPNSEIANRQALVDKSLQGRAYFRQQYENWPNLTAAQKDAALRNAMRALANLCALAAGALDDAGV